MKLNEAEQCWQIRTGKESFEATVNGKILNADWTMLSHGMLLVVGSVTFRNVDTFSFTVNPRLSATIGPARIMADKREWRLIKGA